MKIIGWFAYYLARSAIIAVACTYLRTQLTGKENIPDRGAFLLCPVHRSNIDGPLTAAFTRRRMRYLSKESIFEIDWLGKLFMSMGAIKVNRGAPDRHSLHRCMEALKDGYPLVLFPEGTRKSGVTIEDVNEGAAYLALRANVSIVPVGIAGSEAANPRGAVWLRPAKLHVVIGKPFRLERPGSNEARVPRSAIREGTLRVGSELQAVFDAAMELERGRHGAA